MAAALAAVMAPLCGWAQVRFNVAIQQSRLRVGERTVLAVLIEGEDIDTNRPVQQPEVGAYFRIEGRSGPSVSTRMSIVNGKVSKQSSLEYQYQLVALKPGRFTIPRMSYLSGGKTYFSAPVEVEILNPQAADRIAAAPLKNGAPESDPALKLELDRKEIYAGEQVVAAWRLYFQRGIQNLRVAPAPPAMADFKAMELEKAVQLKTFSRNYRGQPWNVAFIQSYSLYPLAAGQAAIGALELRYREEFAQRDFFGMPVGPEQSVASEPAVITVKPLPEPAPPEFTGAVGEFEIRSELARPEVRVNESNQLAVIVTGDGNPDYVLEPRFVMPVGFEVYPPEVRASEEVRSGRLFSSKRFEYVLVAKTEGELTVPAISFRYFDPKAGEYKLAEAKAITVSVAPGTAISPAGSSAAIPSLEVVSDIRYAKPDRQSLDDQSIGLFGSGWFWAGHLAGILLVAGAIYYRLRRERLDQDHLFARRRQAFGQSKKRLKKAAGLARKGESAEFTAELKRALLEYFGDRFGASPWGLLEENMRAIMAKESVPAETAAAFIGLLSDLSREQFAGKMHADGAELLSRGEKIIAAIEKEKA